MYVPCRKSKRNFFIKFPFSKQHRSNPFKMFDITSMKANYIFCEKNWSVFRRDSKIAWFFYLISLILLKFFILISLLAKNREKSCFFHQIIVIVIKEITGLAVRACLHFSAFLTLYFHSEIGPNFLKMIFASSRFLVRL